MAAIGERRQKEEAAGRHDNRGLIPQEGHRRLDINTTESTATVKYRLRREVSFVTGCQIPTTQISSHHRRSGTVAYRMGTSAYRAAFSGRTPFTYRKVKGHRQHAQHIIRLNNIFPHSDILLFHRFLLLSRRRPTDSMKYHFPYGATSIGYRHHRRRLQPSLLRRAALSSAGFSQIDSFHYQSPHG